MDGFKFKNGRYEVWLPWKLPDPVLPDNYELSLGRLKRQVALHRNDPELIVEHSPTKVERRKLNDESTHSRTKLALRKLAHR